MRRTADELMRLSILVPLFNEEELIVPVLNALLQVQYPAFLESVEVIVVDDRSTDRSYEIAKEYASSQPRVSVHRHERNQGKGAAVRTAAALATGDHLLIQDADRELDPKDIPSMLDAMRTLQVPFINGSRYLPGVLRTQAAYRRYLANRIFTMITSILIDVHLTDMACGYKLLTKELFNKLDLREDRFGFEAELIIKCGRIRRNWIAEVPVHYHPRNMGEGKKLRNSDGLRIFWTIIKYGLLRSK